MIVERARSRSVSAAATSGSPSRLSGRDVGAALGEDIDGKTEREWMPAGGCHHRFPDRGVGGSRSRS